MKEAVSKKIIPYLLIGFLAIATVFFMVFVGSKNPAAEMRQAELERKNKEVSALPESNPDDARTKLAQAEAELIREREREEKRIRELMANAKNGPKDDEAARVAKELNVSLPPAPASKEPGGPMAKAYQDTGASNSKIEAFEDYSEASKSGAAQRSSGGMGVSETGATKSASARTKSGQQIKNQPADKPSLPKMPATKDYMLAEGSVIRTVLVTGLNSQNPGKVIVRTTEDVYDSIRGANLLIPRGTQIIGSYSGEVKAGMDRVPIAFSRMTFPDGRSATLPKMPAVTRTGEVGADGEYHGNLLKAIGPSVLAGIAGIVLDTVSQREMGGSSGGSYNNQNQNPRETVASKVVPDIQKRLADRYADAKPYFTIDPGAPFMVMVTADFAIPPEGDAGDLN